MTDAAESVVLVHGLWMHGLVFVPLRRKLERSGFATTAWSYPSVRGRLADNAEAFSHFLAGLDTDSFHLVGHSLGGIIIACALARHPDPRVRRVVMMGPPWQRSRSAIGMLRVPGASALVGRSMCDWLEMPPPELDGIDIGVIAGSRNVGLAGALVGLPKPNDGIVMVEETRMAQARDAITLRVAHMEMLFSQGCAAQVEAFLRTGTFARDHATGAASP